MNDFSRKRRRSSDHSNDDTSEQSYPLPIGEYEVFLNFRGPDTRSSITNILYRFLARSKIRTFRDDDELRKGEGIWPNLVKAIGQSKISIPIFSPRYTESKWCLKELVEIVEHKNRENGHIILPIFYMVDSRDVRHQTGPYEEAFKQHKRNNNFDEETIQCWKAALNEVGDLKGWHIKTKEEEVDVADVVSGVVWSHLSKNNSKLETDELVGIDDQAEQVEGMLDLGSEGVKVVGLHGMGGIGKTTLATAVYNEVSARFDRHSFVKDIRETQKQDGVLVLQKNLIYDILRMDSVGSTVEAKKIIRERITRFKILVVLDDVDEKFKFEEVLGDPESFASGSRFIATSRDKKVMGSLSKGQSKLYEVQGMDPIRSLQLFCKHAFKKDSPQSGFEALSNAIISTAGGLPLTLKVIGSLLYREEEEVWNDKLKQLKKIPEEEVMERLEISYKGLRREAQQIFLDIACFYIGENKEIASYMWSDCDLYPILNVNILVQRSMLNIGDENEFLMHDQLRDMGREIVRREDIEHPWMRSRIWSDKETFELLLNNKGTDKIKVITLEWSIGVDWGRTYFFDVDLESTCFTNMSELRYFSGKGVKLIGDFTNLLPNLKWMQLGNVLYMDSGDCKATINVKSLNILEVSSSSGYEFTHMKEAHKLKVLVLRNCSKMSKLPEFPESGSLEILEIRCFQNSEEDLKIEKLQNLKVLRLEDYCEIGKIKGGTIGTVMKGLRELKLFGIVCDYDTFRQTIVDIEKLSSLQILNVQSYYLKDVLEGIKLPKSLKQLRTSSGFANVEELLELEEFTIWYGTKLVIPPASGSSRGGDTTSSTLIPWIHSSKLKEIYLLGMKRIIMVESKDTMLPSSLTKLTIYCVHLEQILNLKNLRNLTELKIEKCPNLEEIKGMGGLKSLQVLRIEGARKLTRIHGLGNLMSCSSCKLTRLVISKCPLLREVVTFEQQDDDDDGGGSDGERERYVLVQIESLVRMKIKKSPSIDWRSIHRLSKFPMLQYLTVKNIGLNINEESASQQGQHQLLEGLENLRELVNLSISNVDSKLILNLKNLGNLTELKLSECPNLEEIHGMEGLKSLHVLYIEGARKLTRIHGLGNLMSSSNCELTLLVISECPLLREVVTFEQQDDDDGGGSDGERERYLLVQIESLVTMKIEDSPSIDCRSIPRLSKFPMLKELKIKNIGLNINEESTSQQEHQLLDGLENLQELVELSISNVDSKQILNLKNLGNLTTLHLVGCHNLEEVQGMEALKSLKVLLIHGARKITRIHGLGNLMSSSNCELTGLEIRECPLLREVVTFEQQDDDDDDVNNDDDFLVKMKISSIDGRSTTPMLSKLPMFKYMKFSEYRMAMKGIKNQNPEYNSTTLDKLSKRLSYLRLEDFPALQEIVGPGFFKSLWGLMNECFSFEIKDLPYSSLHRIEFDRRRNILLKFMKLKATLALFPLFPDLSSSISSMEVVEAPEHGLLERCDSYSLLDFAILFLIHSATSSYASSLSFFRIFHFLLLMTLSLLENAPPEPLPDLHLRLLHGWKMGNPARPQHFFAYGTLWVDSQGVRIQGDSHRNFASTLQKRITVGGVYKVSSYTLCPLRPSFRACRFPCSLAITPSTKFELQPSTDPPFVCDSFEFLDFALLPKRIPPCPYLIGHDLVGKVVGVGRPNHVDNGSVVAPVQSIRLADAGGSKVVVSLWSELSHVIDADTVTLDDVSNPVIIGFSCLRIGTFEGLVSFLASETLSIPFSVMVGLPLSFLALHIGAGKPNASSCSATRIIMQPIHPLADQLHQEYRLTVFVSDSTGDTAFILLGQTADKFLPISAVELVRAYPDVYGELPPPIKVLLKQTVTFEIQLPRHTHSNVYMDFKVSKIWGLKFSRTDLMSQLPKPTPPRSPSPPTRGGTPFPPDPRFVPPVYTVIQPSSSASPTRAESIAVADSAPNAQIPPPEPPSNAHALPSAVQLPVPSVHVSQSSVDQPPPKSTPSKTSVTCKKTPLDPSTIPMHLASPSTLAGLLDDIPLRSLARGKRISKDSLAPATPAVLKPSAAPLARVKLEKLRASIGSVTIIGGAPSEGDCSSSDDDHCSLRAMAQTRAKKRLFTV
ncbi:Disease resistance protein L6 [Linum perenne]